MSKVICKQNEPNLFHIELKNYNPYKNNDFNLISVPKIFEYDIKLITSAKKKLQQEVYHWLLYSGARGQVYPAKFCFFYCEFNDYKTFNSLSKCIVIQNVFIKNVKTNIKLFGALGMYKIYYVIYYKIYLYICIRIT